jgi:hypothetical protein
VKRLSPTGQYSLWARDVEAVAADAGATAGQGPSGCLAGDHDEPVEGDAVDDFVQTQRRALFGEGSLGAQAGRAEAAAGREGKLCGEERDRPPLPPRSGRRWRQQGAELTAARAASPPPASPAYF